MKFTAFAAALAAALVLAEAQDETFRGEAKTLRNRHDGHQALSLNKEALRQQFAFPVAGTTSDAVDPDDENTGEGENSSHKNLPSFNDESNRLLISKLLAEIATLKKALNKEAPNPFEDGAGIGVRKNKNLHSDFLPSSDGTRSHDEINLLTHIASLTSTTTSEEKPNPLKNGVDYPGQTFRFCTAGLNCPENPKMHKYDYVLEGTDLASNIPPYGSIGPRYFTQDERQYFFTHAEEFAPVRFISKGNPGAHKETSLELHPDHETISREVMDLQVPVSVPLSPDVTFHYSVAELLTNGEIVTGNSGGQNFVHPVTGKPLRIRDYMPTDGLLIMHDGKIVYENYFDHAEPGVVPVTKFDRSTRHRIFSCTKSYTGTMVAMLKADGKIDDLDDKITKYIPFLKESEGFRDATIRHVLDMSASIAPGGDHTANRCDWAYYESVKNAPRDEYGFIMKDDIDLDNATRDDCMAVEEMYGRLPSLGSEYAEMAPISLDEMGAPYHLPADTFPVGARDAWRRSRKGKDEHGKKFEYLTTKTGVLGWLVDTLTNYTSADFFSERIWSKIGAESDALIEIDHLRTNWWGGGVAATLRDIARFGEVIRRGGKNSKGEQIIPKSVWDDTVNEGNVKQFSASTSSLYGCLVNPAANWSTIDEKSVPCSGGRVNGVNFTVQPVKSWLEAMGLGHTKDTNTNLGYTYRNQFRSLVKQADTVLKARASKGGKVKDALKKSQTGVGVIYQEGVYGQYVWIDQNAKLVIARLGSGNPNIPMPQPIGGRVGSGPINSGPYLDLALYRAFYEIAAYFIRKNNGE